MNTGLHLNSDPILLPYSGIYGALSRQFCSNDQPHCPQPHRPDAFSFIAFVEPAKTHMHWLISTCTCLLLWVTASRSSGFVFTIQSPF